MRIWELAGEVEWKKHLLGMLLAGLCIGNVALAAINISLELGPRYAVRTDVEGHSDLVVLPKSETVRPVEAQRFVEDLALRLFSWDESTKKSDRAYVRERVSATLSEDLSALVPGYRDAQSATAGRIDVDLRTTRVISEKLPYQVEVVVAIEFSGGYAPPGLGVKDPTNPRKEVYGFLFTVNTAPRRSSNPCGLVVSGLTKVAVS